VQQLKKLWANLKQSQRDALTKEKQSRLATGGGPQEIEASVDPDILNIAPHLMETAPVLFTSNMTETEVESKSKINYLLNLNCIIFNLDYILIYISIESFLSICFTFILLIFNYVFQINASLYWT